MIDLSKHFLMGSNFLETASKLNSPIIIGVPHAGNIVPRELHINGLPLGLGENSDTLIAKNIIDTHEGLDKYVAEVLKALDPDNYVASYLSRLVVDKDRVHERIPRFLDDGTMIPANQTLTTEEKDWRIAQFNLFHETKRQLAQEIIKKHGYCLSFDIHTFEPIFKGVRRDVEIGTFKYNENAFTHFVEEELAERFKRRGFIFAKDKPYDVRKNGTMPKCAKRNASERIAETLGVPIIGIEINQLIAQDPELVAHFVEIFSEVTQKAAHHFHPKMSRDPYQEISRDLYM